MLAYLTTENTENTERTGLTTSSLPHREITHAVRDAFDTRFTGHFRQRVAPRIEETVPFGQRLHVGGVVVRTKVPNAHTLHFPVLSTPRPFPHVWGVGVADKTIEVFELRTINVQVAAPASEVVPVGHGLQIREPGAGEKVPAGHTVQVVEPKRE